MTLCTYDHTVGYDRQGRCIQCRRNYALTWRQKKNARKDALPDIAAGVHCPKPGAHIFAAKRGRRSADGKTKFLHPSYVHSFFDSIDKARRSIR
jgi:hypothetical protein